MARRNAAWLIAVLAMLATDAIAASVAPEAAADSATPPQSRQRELLRLLKQDCGACHGLRLNGGQIGRAHV